MPFSTDSANDLARMYFHGVPIELPDVLYVSMHDDDPGSAGKQDAHEVAYGPYARVAVPCNPANWSVVDNTVRLVNTVYFPRKTGGADLTVRWVSIGTEATGPGKVIARGPLATPFDITDGDMPALGSDSSIPFLVGASR